MKAATHIRIVAITMFLGAAGGFLTGYSYEEFDRWFSRTEWGIAGAIAGSLLGLVSGSLIVGGLALWESFRTDMVHSARQPNVSSPACDKLDL